MAEYNQAQSEGNKTAQIATNLDAIDLSPQQEQACLLLASGESYTAVAQRLGVNRGTLYKWQDNLAFRCFYNRLCAIYRAEIKNALVGLHKDAIKAISELLHSDSDNIRLKAATWVLDRIDIMSAETTQAQIIKELLKEKCTYKIGSSIYFDDEDYNKLLIKYGIVDYNSFPKNGE